MNRTPVSAARAPRTARARRDEDAGRRDRRDFAVRSHAVTAAASVALTVGFWLSRPEWAPEMRLWRAFGDAAVVLLFVVLSLGPLARFSTRVGRLLPWRRAIGVWAATTAAVHALLVVHGWAQWDVRRFLGFEFVPQLGRVARMEPGFGLANLVGLVALVWLAVLAATSSDRAVRRLGPAGWKWLHTGAYTVFHLSVLHAAYFLFLHFTVSFHKPEVPVNWFRVPLLVMGVLVLVLQVAAFVRTVRRRRDAPLVDAERRPAPAR